MFDISTSLDNSLREIITNVKHNASIEKVASEASEKLGQLGKNSSPVVHSTIAQDLLKLAADLELSDNEPILDEEISSMSKTASEALPTLSDEVSNSLVKIAAELDAIPITETTSFQKTAAYVDAFKGINLLRQKISKNY
jgi:hypothetical protein